MRPRPFRCIPATLALATACRQPEPPAESAPQPEPLAASPPAAPPLTPPPPSPTDPPVDTPPPSTPPAVTPPANPPSAPTFAGPLAATAIDGGVLLAWARHADDGGTAIMAQRLDASGLEVGAPTLLHRDPDDIVALALDRAAGDAWLAWVTQSATGTRVAATTVPPDLFLINSKSITPPIALTRFTGSTAEQWGSDPDVRVLARADGRALVAASGGRTSCTDTVTRRPTKCPAFALTWVKPDRKTHRAGLLGVDGGQPGLGDLVDLGDGVVFHAWAWHGGPTFASTFIPAGDDVATPSYPLVTCRPPYTRGFTGSELVTLCPDDYAGDGERCPLPGADGSCARVHAVKLDGTFVTPRDPTPIATQTRRCHAGHPVLEVTWDGGSLRLDPQAPGADLDLDLGLWTGAHAIVITPNGARERWSCTSTGDLVLAEPLPALAL